MKGNKQCRELLVRPVQNVTGEQPATGPQFDDVDAGR